MIGMAVLKFELKLIVRGGVSVTHGSFFAWLASSINKALRSHDAKSVVGSRNEKLRSLGNLMVLLWWLILRLRRWLRQRLLRLRHRLLHY